MKKERRNMKQENFAGDSPCLVNIHNASCGNGYFRKEIWTGEYAQVTVMSIPIGGEVGLDLHEGFDQILFVEYGVASVYVGKTKQEVKFFGSANSGCAVIIPAGVWHNLINEQNVPLKIVSVYAPPHHPVGTVHKTKFDSDLADY